MNIRLLLSALALLLLVTACRSGELSRTQAKHIIEAHFSETGRVTRDIPVGRGLHMAVDKRPGAFAPIRLDMYQVYRELERRNLIEMADRGNLPGWGTAVRTFDVGLTPEGTKQLGPVREGRPDYDTEPSAYQIPQSFVTIDICVRKVNEITGIRIITPGSEVEAEYSWVCEKTSDLADLVTRASKTAHAYRDGGQPPAQGNDTARLVRYDDGWRLARRPGSEATARPQDHAPGAESSVPVPGPRPASPPASMLTKLSRALLYRPPTWRDQWLVFRRENGLSAMRGGMPPAETLVPDGRLEIAGALRDSNEIVFMKNLSPGEEGFCEAFAVSLADRRPRLLTSGGENCSVAVSPDGSRLAIGKQRWDVERWKRASQDDRYHGFNFFRPGGLWLHDLRTGQQEQIVRDVPVPIAVRRRTGLMSDADWDGYIIDSSILWSPDGSMVAFTRWRGEVHNFLYVASTTSSGEPRLISGDLDARGVARDWCGTKLLFAGSNDYTEDDRLYVHDTSTGATVDLGLGGTTGVFSEDCKRLLVGKESLTSSLREIWACNADGSDARKLLDDAYDPVWGLDEKQVAFVQFPKDGGNARVRLLELGSGEVSPTAEEGKQPLWVPASPVLSFWRIAFLGALGLGVVGLAVFGVRRRSSA